MNNVSEVVMDSQERDTVIPAPVRHPEGEISLLVREMGESTKYRSNFLTKKVLQIPRGIDGYHGLKFSELFCVLLDLVLHFVYVISKDK